MKKYSTIVIFILLVFWQSCSLSKVRHEQICTSSTCSNPTLFNEILDISEEVLGDLDRKKNYALLQEILDDLDPLLKAATTPEEKISAINEVLFKRRNYRFPYDMAQFELKKVLYNDPEIWDLKYSLLPKLLEDHTAFCISLSSLYLVIAEHFELPIFPVFTFEHVFVRWDDGITKINIETLEQGKNYGDVLYQKRFNIPDSIIKNGLYLGDTYKQRRIIASIYGNISQNFFLQEDHPNFVKYTEKGLAVDPESINLLLYKGWVFFVSQEYEKASEVFKKILNLWPDHSQSTHSLGLIYLFQEQYEKAYSKFADAYSYGAMYSLGQMRMAYNEMEFGKPKFTDKGRLIVEHKELILSIPEQLFRAKGLKQFFIEFQTDQSLLDENPHIFVIITKTDATLSDADGSSLIRNKIELLKKEGEIIESEKKGCDLFYSVRISDNPAKYICSKKTIIENLLVEFELVSRTDFVQEYFFNTFDHIFRSLQFRNIRQRSAETVVDNSGDN